MRPEALDIHDRVTLSSLPLSAEKRASDSQGPSFDQVLQESLQTVDHLQKEADQAMQRLAVDGGMNLHKTMIAVEKADLSFRLMMQIRNKIVEAYQEVMRMQV